MRYSKHSGRGNFFSLPNEVFLLGLSAGELSVYSFLPLTKLLLNI